MNFARDVVAARDPDEAAIIELSKDGSRQEWTFGEVDRLSGGLAGRLAALGVSRGDVVLTLIGNRIEWVIALVACFRMGAVALPCNEQLRAKDLRLRIDLARPMAILVDERNLSVLGEADPDCPVLPVPDPSLYIHDPLPYVELDLDDGCLLTFTSGTEGDPKGALHVQRYLTGQQLNSRYWLDARPGDLIWCTAASGWSKSARNAFIAPWLGGAAGLVHDGRFDPAERLEILAREEVNVLCMAPTEYRVIAKRTDVPSLPEVRRLVAAGEALNPEVLGVWHQATGINIRDGYGQTETGAITGTPLDKEVRPGSMGCALPGVSAWIDDGELVVDPRTVPTFFHQYLGHPPVSRDEPWRTGDRVRDEDGWFFFEGRNDDLIVSSGYRIGPFEVESALISHQSVAEAAVVAAADDERGEVVRAVVVLRGDAEPGDGLVRELQDHVKETTAPYKYPRQIEFVEELPKTVSGKVRRAKLRNGG